MAAMLVLLEGVLGFGALDEEEEAAPDADDDATDGFESSRDDIP